MKSHIFISLVTLTNGALAHGGVYRYIFANSTHNTTYHGFKWFEPLETQPGLMQRSWYPDPIYDPATSNITCSWNGSAGPDAFHAPIAAGDNITAHWDNEYDWYNPNLPFPYACNATSITNKYDCAGNHWFHGIGPILAYMADCGDDCSVVDPSTLNWFKIAEAVNKPGGLIRDASSWYQSRLVAHSNVAPGWTVTIPQELKPGNYLIRHEMMYLFGSPTQIYVNCAQLAVTSQGNRIPSSEYLVKFPGAYRMDEPGILTFPDPKQAYLTNETVYHSPGPKVWTGVA